MTKEPHVSFALSIIVLAAVFLALPGPPALVQAQTPDKVEEDWQVVIATPDITGVAPQITTCMSPLSDVSTTFVAFYLNYSQNPSFQAGGLQVQVWSNDQPLTNSPQGSRTTQHGQRDDQMDAADERVGR